MICGDVNVNAFGGSRQDVLRISTFGLRTGFEGGPHIGRDLAYKRIAVYLRALYLNQTSI